MLALGTILIASVGLAVPAAGSADPLTLVHHWDAQRAAAYRAQAPALLSGLYVRGSTAGRTDLATLRAYGRRGIRVTGLTSQVFAAHVLTRTGSLLRVRVTGRVLAAGDDGRQCIRLPASPTRTRLLTLRRVDGRWVMAAVRPVSRGGAGRR